MPIAKELTSQRDFSDTELTALANAINNPVIQAYLNYLRLNAILDIAHAIPATGESLESFTRRVSGVQGGLSAIETLLAIEAPETAV